jgi:coatomer protein complex subunit alpha (xenin)
LIESGQYGLAYTTSKIHGLNQLTEEIKEKFGDKFKIPELSEEAELILPPVPINKNLNNLNWPLLVESEKVDFDEEDTNVENNESNEIDTKLWGTEGILVNNNNQDNDEENITDENKINDSDFGSGWLANMDGIEIDKKLLINSNKTDFENVTVGKAISDYWIENSDFPADHIASGSFKTAMDILNKKAGIINFEPLKQYFISIYKSSKSILPISPILPSMGLYLQRSILNEKIKNLEEMKQNSFPALSNLTYTELQNQYNLTLNLITNAKFLDAQKELLQILTSISLIVPNNKKEVNEIKELIKNTVEYSIAVLLEITRNNTKDQKRASELSAYFTHCKINNIHLILSLFSAMTISFKQENFVTSTIFAKRLRKLSPPKNLADQVIFNY